MKSESKNSFTSLHSLNKEDTDMTYNLEKQRVDLAHKKIEKEKNLTDAKQENQRLKEQQRSATQDLCDLREQYERGRHPARMNEKKSKAYRKEVDCEYRQLYTEHILLRNAVEKLEKKLIN
ncbi:hypothetical protein WMY93_006941 [Mugilogobius chulae]|uniref:Uncharacterized protein n=1 Tax=Mugilogobius chulae TaxID=88201 RepID=A0AAW0PNU0_9GOBI